MPSNIQQKQVCNLCYKYKFTIIFILLYWEKYKFKVLIVWQEWTDELLTWDPDEYGGQSSVVLDPRDIWVPKLGIGNRWELLW